MPGKPGDYDLSDIAKWLLDARGARAERDGESPKLAWERHRAELARLKVEREKGQLIETETFRQQVLRLCGVFRAGLLALPSMLSAQLEGLDAAERQSLIEARISEVLAAVSTNATHHGPPQAKREAGASSKGPTGS